MDAHIFRMLCHYLAAWLPGARMERIQEPSRDHLTLTFYKSGIKRNLIFRFSRKEPFCFLSDKRPDAQPKPTAQIMRFRKYLADRHIQAVICQPWSRKIWLMAGPAAMNGMVWLCLDLAQGPSLHFLEEPPEEEMPRWPAVNELNGALKEWVNWPMLTPALRRTMNYLDEPEKKALLLDLEEGGGDIFIYFDSHGVQKISAWPLPPVLAGNLKEEAVEDLLPALEKAGQSLVLAPLTAAKSHAWQLAMNRRRRHLTKTLDKLDQDERKLNAMQGREEEALLLAAHLWQLDGGAKLPSVSVGEGAEAREIILNNRLTVSQNMERMFHNAKRGKRGLAMLDTRRKQLVEELEGSPAAADSQRPTERGPAKMPGIPKGVQPFRSSDGFVLLRGRDARGNLALRRAASGHDIWVHVETGPGAHVLIKRQHAGQEVPERTLDEAGNLAANKSWLRESGSAAIMYAEMRHVKPCRSGPVGKVTVDKLRETRLVKLDPDMEGRLTQANS